MEGVEKVYLKEDNFSKMCLQAYILVEYKWGKFFSGKLGD